MAQVETIYKSDGKVLSNEGTKCTLAEGKTRQEDAAGADVNLVLARVMRGQELLPAVDPQVYADVSGIVDFRDAMEKVTRANQAFAQLDAPVRAAFENDPALFLDAFQDPDGLKKLEGLGVVKLRDAQAELDAAEAAVEERAAKRVLARERAARVKAAEADPTPSSGKGS